MSCDEALSAPGLSGHVESLLTPAQPEQKTRALHQPEGVSW